MNGNDSGVADARDRLREKAQNEATCIALNDMLKDAQKEIVRLREENERLRASPPQSLSPWQPIATAPKDKRILLYRPTTAGWWQVMGGKYDSDEYTKNPKPYWRADNWSLGKMEQRQHTPTHWMPLPEPAP